MKHLTLPDTFLFLKLYVIKYEFQKNRYLFFFLFRSNVYRFVSYSILLLVGNYGLFKHDRQLNYNTIKITSLIFLGFFYFSLRLLLLKASIFFLYYFIFNFLKILPSNCWDFLNNTGNNTIIFLSLLWFSCVYNKCT